jgi:hypothetical protein
LNTLSQSSFVQFSSVQVSFMVGPALSFVRTQIMQLV